jgi:hypothetical protein
MSTFEHAMRRGRGISRSCQLFLALASMAAWTNVAHASEVFPPKIRETLGLTADPACTICHATDEGEDGTVVKPFGISMQRLGVTGDSDTQKLVAALAAAESRQLDSDFDGVPDVTELREGSDPNDGVTLPIPQTGCFVERAGAGSASAVAMMTLALIALALRARRRRRFSPAGAQFAHRVTR